MALENLISERAILRNKMSYFGRYNYSDLLKLTDLDMKISRAESARKHPKWTKFKNKFVMFGLIKSNENERQKHPVKGAAKMLWNGAVLTTKNAMVFPVALAYVVRDTVKYGYRAVKNTQEYCPKAKNKFSAYTMAVLSPLVKLNSGSSMATAVRAQDLVKSKEQAKPQQKKAEGKSTILSRLGLKNERKTTAEAPKKREHTSVKTSGARTGLSPETVRRIIDNVQQK